METKTVVIVGAGPAGLAVAGRLSNIGFEDYIILEKSGNVGNAWRHHYDRLHLHTVKQWSHLPHMPFPKDYPTYVPRGQVVEYLDNYARHFNINPRFGVTVDQIKRSEDLWVLSTSQGDLSAKHVVIATGVNKTPHCPSWPGLEEFQGSVVHSTEYKNPEPYLDKSVLIVGMGNTGAELAFDLSEYDVETHIAVRSPISLVPRDLNGQPVQVTAKKLAKLPFGFGDWLGSQIRKVYFGNMEKYGLRISKMHPAVQLRETGKTPVIDIGTIEAIKKGKVKVHPNVKRFSRHHVEFENGEKVKVDHVILATGFTADLVDLIPSISDFLDHHNLPKGIIANAANSGLYFIGFDNYKVGGILGTIHTDSKDIVESIIATN